MKSRSLDAALAAANPFSVDSLSTIGFAETRDALLETVAELDSVTSISRVRRTRGDGTLRTTHRLGIVLAAATLLAASILGIVLTGGEAPTGSSPAYGAALIRYARNSPLVLLEQPGWHVSDVVETNSRAGEMSFVKDGSSSGEEGASAPLSWQSASMHLWPGGVTARVLGVGAHVSLDGTGRHGKIYIAVWRYHGQSLSFRATVRSLGRFRVMLAALRPASEEQWLASLPASVITAAERPATVDSMLNGVPRPPGLDIERLTRENTTNDRYQVGASVAGTVACLWIKSWARGRLDGDRRQVQAAISAMASSATWPVLREMEHGGAYAQVVEEYAADMPSGAWLRHPLAVAVESGLGCAQRGILIPMRSAEARQLREANREGG